MITSHKDFLPLLLDDENYDYPMRKNLTVGYDVRRGHTKSFLTG